VRLTRRGERLMIAWCWIREQWVFAYAALFMVAVLAVAGAIEGQTP